ncbi:hypothetical protein GF371_02985 [Candidatus Woesearchaeota archaeon]|nr:hypothetical protein [Candidatus Woesearchaeota archaeon]
MKNKKRWPRVLTLALLAAQLIAVLLLLPILIRELNWLVIVVPAIVALLLIGDYMKSRTTYILTFIWSILLLIHAVALIIMQLHYAYIMYLAFAAFFLFAVSQSSLR